MIWSLVAAARVETSIRRLGWSRGMLLTDNYYVDNL